MKRTGRITLQISLFCVLVAVLTSGCSIFDRDFSATHRPPSTKGTLVLALNDGALKSKALVPPISMEPASFTIQGAGPDPGKDYFERLLDADDPHADEPLLLKDLSPGDWTVTVQAWNEEGTLIGHGETDPAVLIEAGEITAVLIDVLPLSGTGGLSLAVQWPQGAHTHVRVESSLMSARTGEDLKPEFTLYPTAKAPIMAAYTNTAIEAGYYQLDLRLYDPDGLFWFITMESVRIVADQTTAQSWFTD